jgi:hypothetical protein
MATIRRILPLLLLPPALAACGNSDNLPDPTAENFVDTVTVGSLTDTPVTTSSGFRVGARQAIRTDIDSDFDFAYDIEGDPASGTSVIVPRAALGIDEGSSAQPGVMPRTEAFDALEVAPSNGYVTDQSVPIALGERYIVRSRVRCSLGVPVYAKIEIIGFEDNSVILKVLANTNCGYRGLEPGFPDR